MRKLLLCTTVALFGWACSGDGGTPPKVATSISFSPGSVTFDAIGATQMVHATVRDQNGQAMAGVPVTWGTGTGTVAVAALGGDSALFTSAGNGQASISATSGAATGAVGVQVAQVATALQKFSGDTQTGAISGLLAAPVRVRVLDRLGAGVAGQTVTFTITTGGGTVSSATAVSEADGTAAVSWTLGASAGAQTVTATLNGSSTVTPAVFTATATTANVGFAVPFRGHQIAAMVGTPINPTPAIQVQSSTGQPVPGVSVTFTVTAGGGTIGGSTTVTTGADGVASVASWTLGTTGPNILRATVNAGGYVGSPVDIRAYGCQGGGGAGFGITLCITTPMTASQRASFESAAARWAGVISGDLTNVAIDLGRDECGDNTPAINMNVDDLLIFASAPNIDGPGAVLGQAGWCLRRSGALPALGVMEFDAADMANMEQSGQLNAVILHEMGHVLGIGTLWNAFGLLKDPSPTSGAGLDTWYSGTGGITGFDNIGGTTYTGGNKVPVENSGGGGTVNSHWRESVLKNELMTGFINGGANPLSQLTARSLGDLGYLVNISAADAFNLTLALRATRTGTRGAEVLEMKDDIYTGPQYTVDSRGRKTRVR
ncbi:MAG TPA: leishmanolysin-related zinc metalloendopeptidase [Longimicrobium sp.]|nr:leishmanolysin-related zinc metalloendopeptidase [Longimicrobium sp.]